MELLDPDSAYVSSGELPPYARVAELVATARDRFSGIDQGEVSTVYPALARMPSALFGVCVVDTQGRIHAAGDAEHPFTIMSVSKPFVFALICERIGATSARARLGVNATGRSFNSLAGIEAAPEGRTNPMVNAGAIATSSLAPGRYGGQMALFAGGTVTLRRAGVVAERRGIRVRFADEHPQPQHRLDAGECGRHLLRSAGGGRPLHPPMRARRDGDGPCRDGATLADGGFNPVTREQVVNPDVCHYTLAVMLTAGMYETSGDWLYEIGLPGKSGIGGGIVTISPGKGGLGTFAPPLDAAGNSVRGQLAAQFLSQRLGLDLLASTPRKPS